MTATVDQYLSLLASQHRHQPNLVASLTAVLQPLVDAQNLALGLSALFDQDTAVGQQLDVVGQWVGASRQINIPLVGVYFSWDTAGLGWDQGNWQGPFDPSTGLVQLDDEHYRLLLRARILNNHWNGQIDKDPALYVGGDINGALLPGAVDLSAYAIWDTLFAGTDAKVVIFDYGDLTMGLALLDPTPDAVTQALFLGGYLDVKPAGVRINDRYIITDLPAFAWGLNTADFAGWDTGSWAKAA